MSIFGNTEINAESSSLNYLTDYADIAQNINDIEKEQVNIDRVFIAEELKVIENSIESNISNIEDSLNFIEDNKDFEEFNSEIDDSYFSMRESKSELEDISYKINALRRKIGD